MISKLLPDLGYFDAVVSDFAIHHLKHERTRKFYEEVYDIINPIGIFCNLEHVASPSVELHVRFLKAIGCNPESEGRALPMEMQLRWLVGSERHRIYGIFLLIESRKCVCCYPVLISIKEKK